MKISYNWLCDYIQTSYSVDEIAEILTATGLEVESVEKVEAIPGGLKGVVVGEVMTCEKHPDADRLSLTRVSIGTEELLPIVCGAPNVAAGQKVLVATIGAKLFPTEGEPFVIKKGKIRGQESHGMICAEDELGLGKSHAGIMVLDSSAVPGTPAAAFLQISEDYCIEIGLTPNRTDAISHYGVARDLHAAIRNMVGAKSDQPQLKRPRSKALQISKSMPAISIEVADVSSCPRYCGITLEGVKVGPSPEWMQKRLSVIGLRPINNIVDITNYVQHEMGQPLHAFDAAQIGGNKVVVRKALLGEKFVTLDGVERELSSEDLMICDESKPMCIAGVFGGLHSGVSESTQKVFLESAYFNPVSVRKTARRHGLHTDASFRFERGCDPQITMEALHRAAEMIIEIAGGHAVDEALDLYTEKFASRHVQLNWQRCVSLIGKDPGKEVVKNILNDLEIEVVAEQGDEMTLSVPLYRNDVYREADVVEEILRIYGYNNIEYPQGLKSSLSFAPQPDPEKIQHRASEYLAANGFHEMMSMSLTKSKYVEFLPESERSQSVALLNPLSSDLGVMRQTLLFSGLEAISLNRNHRNADLKLFEFGKVYSKSEDNYNEKKMLSLFLSGSRLPESWNNQQGSVSFQDLRGHLDNMLKVVSIRGAAYHTVEHSYFDDALQVVVGKHVLSVLGSISGKLLQAFDIKTDVWYAEVHWDTILKLQPEKRVSYKEPEKFPSVRRDLSLLLNRSVKYAEIEKLAYESERKLLREVNLFDVYEGKNLEAGKKSYAISFVLQDSTKTMTDQQVDGIMAKIQKSFEEKLGAELRK
ncbi:MAG: phenylalanine--tRNA ligase subunit beta [Flavobacteriales bacterium]|nr:phenylalanine--tRNA ligase subunit beta [Flavobacteriales bacterium]